MYSPGGGRISFRKDGTKRVASGGVKSGLPLIITGGQARHEAFQYNFTDPGKFKKAPGFGQQKVSEKLAPMGSVKKQEIAEQLKYACPANFCPDCNRIDRPTGQGGFLNMISIADDEYAGIGLIPGKVVLTIWCQECVEGHEFAKKNLAISQGDETPEGLVLPPSQDIAPEHLDEWRLNMIRGNRMQKNMIEYLRNQIMARNPKILVNPDDIKEFR